jgi:hypothetical protein
MIEGTLHLLEGDEIVYVFDQTPPLSRTAYKHMCAWVLTNFDSKFNESPEALWAEAKMAWTSLTPETKGLLFSLQAREEQMVKDIRVGLLATLADYQGVGSVKERFADAIRAVN